MVANGPKKPEGWYGHAVSIIHSPLKGDYQTLLLVTGRFLRDDAWLLSVGGGTSWREVSIMNG